MNGLELVIPFIKRYKEDGVFPPQDVALVGCDVWRCSCHPVAMRGTHWRTEASG
jgi:hypothetical protein